jgi:NADH-quinone oxidoreductase subunit C
MGVGVGDGEQSAALVAETFPDAVLRSGSYRNQHWVEIEPRHLAEVCRWLRDDGRASFDFLVDVTAVHWPDDPRPIEIVYHLFSYGRNDRLRLKLRTTDRGPVPSLTGLWRSADWNEREVFDLFGVEFTGHPDLRRILMPDDYTDFPMRKEFPLYRG